MKLLVACLGVVLLMSSCVDIFDELILHADGSGTYKYTVNLSASKVKINSVLALDSLDGRRVPKLQEIKDKIALYQSKLESKDGISNVKVDANYTDFVFKISCDFISVTALQNGIRDVIMEESKDKSDPIFAETWLTWDGQKLVRSVPDFQAPLHKLKPEDQELLKTGKYIVVSRFDTPVEKCDNATAQISPTKTAVMVKSTPFAIAQNPAVLKNTIYLSGE